MRVRRLGHVLFCRKIQWEENVGDRGGNGEIILKRFLKKHDLKIWTGFIWLRIETNCEVL
jgi:hypothetical protein